MLYCVNHQECRKTRLLAIASAQRASIRKSNPHVGDKREGKLQAVLIVADTQKKMLCFGGMRRKKLLRAVQVACTTHQRAANRLENRADESMKTSWGYELKKMLSEMFAIFWYLQY